MFGFLHKVLVVDFFEEMQPDLKEICADRTFMLIHLYLEKCHRYGDGALPAVYIDASHLAKSVDPWVPQFYCTLHGGMQMADLSRI